MVQRLTFQLPGWPETTAECWRATSARAARLAKRVGSGPAFTEQLALARALIDRGADDEIGRRLNSAMFARALASVWAHEPDRARASMRAPLVAGLVHDRPQVPSRLLLLTIAQAFFNHFDRLDQWQPGLFNAVRNTLVDGMSRTAPTLPNGFIGSLATIALRSDQLLDPHGPHTVAQEIEATGVTLDEWFQRTGMGTHETGRFGLRVRQEVYLRRIETGDHTKKTGLEFLDDLTSETVYGAPGTTGMLFGHDLLRALALRPDSAPCEEWMSTLVAIGGDPRLRHTTQWRRWWAPLDESTQRAAIRWFSLEDLELYLTAVENYGHEEQNVSLLRMFPSRKTFLMGLHHSGLLQETRLVLGSAARQSVRRQLGSTRADISILGSPSDTAVIIMDCGSFFLVEGSHNFTLRLYAGAANGRLLDRSRREFTKSDLTDLVMTEQERNHPLGVRARMDVRHQGLWQAAAIDFIVEKLGINLDIRYILDQSTYQELKYRFGLPVPGRSLLRW